MDIDFMYISKHVYFLYNLAYYSKLFKFVCMKMLILKRYGDIPIWRPINFFFY